MPALIQEEPIRNDVAWSGAYREICARAAGSTGGRRALRGLRATRSLRRRAGADVQGREMLLHGGARACRAPDRAVAGGFRAGGGGSTAARGDADLLGD
jgi:hypothetical protein